MTNVLMISMDATLLTGATGDSRARHEEYARRAGTLNIVVCSTASLDPLDARQLQIVPTRSRNRLAYLIDGYHVGQQMAVRCRPDVITSQDPFLTGIIGLRLSRALRVPFIVQDVTSAVDNREFARESRINWGLQQLARQIVRCADAVRVLNQAEKAACVRLGVPPERVRVIPIPTDLARFTRPSHPMNWRQQLGLTPTDRVAVWVGRPVHVKNLPLLLDAFARVCAQLPDARLVLAGDIRDDATPAQIKRLGLTSVVKLAGRVAHADLPALYQAADVYVHSSRYEGFGVVLVEAAAAGLPLISTDTDGAREIIRAGETGLIVPHKVDALADALISLLGDSDRAQAMGERARADVLVRFDGETIIDQWVGMWHEVSGDVASRH